MKTSNIQLLVTTHNRTKQTMKGKELYKQVYKQYRKKVWDSTQLSELYGKQCITRENIDARIEPMQHGPQKNKTTKKNGWRPLDIANMANEIEEERRFKTNMDKTVRLFHIYISIYYPN